MNIVKIWICNKVEKDFLTNRLILYIERKIVVVFRQKIIIDDFIDSKEYFHFTMCQMIKLKYIKKPLFFFLVYIALIQPEY